MVTDRQGNALAGATPRAAEYFDAAIASFNLYRGDPLGTIDNAIAEAPGFAMAHIAKAYMFATATEPAATAEARNIVVKLAAMRLGERERSHLRALELQL